MKFILLKPVALPFLFILFIYATSSSIEAQSVQTNISTDSLSIGDTFTYSLIIQQDKEYRKIEFPDTNSFPASVELLNRQQYKRSEFSDSLIYNLQYFGNEDLQLPSLPVTFYSDDDTSEIYTEPILLYFNSVIAEGDTTLKPLKPNFAFSRTLWPWILAGLILTSILIWWFLLREEPEEMETEPKLEIKPFYNPVKELEKTLRDIKTSSNLAETKNFKQFYSEVGDAIRTYFEELYNIPALESTSSELLRYMDAYGVDDILTEKTRLILRKADLVKFAKFTPTLEHAWETYDLALEFLERAQLADTARITRLKTKYDAQFKPESTQNSEEVQ